MTAIFNKQFWLIFGTLVLVELASASAFFYWPLAVVCCILIFVATVYLALQSLEWGIYLALTEAVVGGFGYLFFVPLGNFKLSIRLIIFAAVILAWVIQLIKKRSWSEFKNKYFMALLPFIGCIVLGLILALVAGRNLKDIFLDVNNYLYLGLILPAIFSRPKLESIVKIILAGSWLLAFKTTLVLLFFSRHWAVLHDDFYNLIRETGIGEITLITDPLYRIFFQSHFYNLVALILALALLLFIVNDRRQKWLLGLTVWINFFILLIGQSRTFWLAGALGILLLAAFLIKEKRASKIIWLITGLAACLLTGHLALNAVIGDFSINLFYSRLNQGDSMAGVSSRSAQIAPALAAIAKAPLFGQGFNTSITYNSSDPRNRNSANPEGVYTTDALELGYLDIALKMGILGLLAYGYFLLLLLLKLYQKSVEDYRLIGLTIGLVMLLAIHMLTPYLNHPLGISYLIVLVSLL